MVALWTGGTAEDGGRNTRAQFGAEKVGVGRGGGGGAGHEGEVGVTRAGLGS